MTRFVTVLAVMFAAVATAADRIPVMVMSAPGRFEIAALDSSVAHAIAAASEEAWRTLSPILSLPESFSTPIFVRVAPADVNDPIPFRVSVEPGGIVSLRIRDTDNSDDFLRRALVQGLLLRLAVARHGVNDLLTVPLWLEHACVAWWRTRSDAAQLDAAKQQAASMAPPPVATLLNWQRGSQEPTQLGMAALWLLTFLQTEAPRPGDWHTFLQRVLSGVDSIAELRACYGERFSDDRDRELWWLTGFHAARRARSLPTYDAAESRQRLGALSRFVFVAGDDSTDVVVPLRTTLGQASSAIVGAELARRALETDRLVPALHPFYRNAGLTLAEALRSGSKPPPAREELGARFEADWQDAVELEASSSEALDRWEQR